MVLEGPLKFLDKVNFFGSIGSLKGAKITVFVRGGLKALPYGKVDKSGQLILNLQDYLQRLGTTFTILLSIVRLGGWS